MAGLQGRAFGGYQLVEQLPAGGIADVYRGRPTKAGGRDVVVKVIYPEFARQPGFLPRFRSIVELSGKLSSHPHILPLLAHGEDAGYLYLVTPCVEGGTLRDWLQTGGRMNLADAAPFFRQLCDALGYAHSLGVVHGNLKPSNVFLFEGRHVLLGDFGMLWDVSQMDMNHAGSGAEAVEYLAPEVLGGQVTQLSDIYSLGAVLYSAVAGHAPFHGGKPADVFAAHARLPVPSLAQVTPPLAAGVAALDPALQRAMAKRPEDRYPSAAAVAQAIELTARQAQASAPAAGGPAPMPAFGAAQIAQGFASPAVGAPFVPGTAPIAPVFGAPVAGMVGGMGGVAGMAADVPGAGLAHLDPPFPPLPPSARVEEQMEQGRVQPQQAETGTQATIRVPAPLPQSAALGGDVPLQPTVRVPAPPGLAPIPDAGSVPGSAGSLSRHSGLSGLLESSPNLRAVSPGQLSERRPYRISGAPAARLGGLSAAAGPAGTSPFGEMGDDEDDDESAGAHQMLPAVRPGSAAPGPAAGGMSPPGFAVAGGAGGVGAPAGERDLLAGEQSAFGSAESREWRVFGGSQEVPAYTDEQASYRQDGYGHEAAPWDDAAGGMSDEHAASGWGERSSGEQTGYGAAMGDDHAEQPFSPTQLGLPRLTSPVMMDQPLSFHDILSDSGHAPRFDGGVSAGDRAPQWSDAGESMWSAPGSAPLTPWRENAPRVAADADGWASSEAGAWGSAPSLASAAPGTPMAWEPEPSMGDFAADGKRGKNARKARSIAEDDSGFDDERVWTVGTTAVRAGRRRWVRKLALVLVLVLLADMIAVIAVRPDLCPNASCRHVSAFVHQKLAFLHAGPSVAVSLVAAPAVLSFNATAGKSATMPFVLTNTGKADLTWAATSALPWLSLDHTGGTLGPGAHQPLVLTAKPIGVKPGSYATTLTITAGTGTLAVPITVAVAAGALLGVTPASLSFDTCGTAQTVTLTNTGAAPLTFTAVPSQTSALSLDTTTGSLGPGQSRAISVTLLCGASSGDVYTVNVISNSGSAVVTVHYS